MDDNYYDPDCAVPDVFAWYCAEHAHPLDVEIERHADDAQ
jgi:hypothetical protein